MQCKNLDNYWSWWDYTGDYYFIANAEGKETKDFLWADFIRQVGTVVSGVELGNHSALGRSGWQNNYVVVKFNPKSGKQGCLLFLLNGSKAREYLVIRESAKSRLLQQAWAEAARLAKENEDLRRTRQDSNNARPESSNKIPQPEDDRVNELLQAELLKSRQQSEATQQREQREHAAELAKRDAELKKKNDELLRANKAIEIAEEKSQKAVAEVDAMKRKHQEDEYNLKANHILAKDFFDPTDLEVIHPSDLETVKKALSLSDDIPKEIYHLSPDNKKKLPRLGLDLIFDSLAVRGEVPGDDLIGLLGFHLGDADLLKFRTYLKNPDGRVRP